MNTSIRKVETRLFHIPLAEVLVDAKHGEHHHFELVTVTITLEDGTEGTGYTYTGGKGGHAIAAAYDQIVLGHADVMICGGAEAAVCNMALSGFEDSLSEVWPKCLDGDERAFRVISAFWRVMQSGAAKHRADVILVDLGPNLGAINRAALIASDFVVIPLGPDLFSLQGLQNLGPTLRKWRRWPGMCSSLPPVVKRVGDHVIVGVPGPLEVQVPPACERPLLVEEPERSAGVGQWLR